VSRRSTHTIRKYRQCIPKQWKLQHRECAIEIALVIFNETAGRTRLDVYACPFCGLHYLGHTPLTRNQQRERARRRKEAI
jgi:hypothetical protein